MRVATCLLVVVASTSALADEAVDVERDPHRLGIELTAGFHGRYPGAYEDPGGQLVLSRPLWYSGIAGPFQADSQVHLLVGLGKSGTFYPGTYLSVGGYLHIVDWLSFEVRVGPGTIVQLGEHGAVPVVGLFASGGWVFRFWDDPRTRLRLSLATPHGFVIGADDGSDCASCYGYTGFGLAFETPL